MSNSQPNPTKKSPFHNLIPDCCNIIFQFYIQRVDRNDVFTKEDMEFFKKYMFSWKLRNYQTNVNEYLKEILGEKPAFYHVDIMMHEPVHPKSFELLEGVKSLDISHSTVAEDVHHKDDVLRHVTGVQHLDIGDCRGFTNEALSYVKDLKSLRMTLCEIGDDGLKHLDGSLRRLEARRCNNLTQDALQYLHGIEFLDVSFCSNFVFKLDDVSMITDSLKDCKELAVDRERFACAEVKKIVSDLVEANGGVVRIEQK